LIDLFLVVREILYRGVLRGECPPENGGFCPAGFCPGCSPGVLSYTHQQSPWRNIHYAHWLFVRWPNVHIPTNRRRPIELSAGSLLTPIHRTFWGFWTFVTNIRQATWAVTKALLISTQTT